MEGRTWSLSEVPEFGGNMTSDCPIQSDRWPDPPAVIRQHASCQRSFVALSAQVNFRVFQPFVFPSCPRCPSCPGCPSCNPSYPHCPSCPGCPGCNLPGAPLSPPDLYDCYINREATFLQLIAQLSSFVSCYCTVRDLILMQFKLSLSFTR